MPISVYMLIPILCAASLLDWRKRVIPNALLLVSFLLAFLFNFITMGFSGLLLSLMGTILGFALLVIPYLLGGMGAGDVKLLMVIGSFGGWQIVLYSFFLGAMAGGLIAIGVYIYNLAQNKKISSLPYGIPLSLGTILCILLGNGRF